MTPEVYQLHACLDKYKTKNVPQIIEACFAKLRTLELSTNPADNLSENLKAVILLLKHLQKSKSMSPEIVEYLQQFLEEVMKNDRRAKHALDVLNK